MIKFQEPYSALHIQVVLFNKITLEKKYVIITKKTKDTPIILKVEYSNFKCSMYHNTILFMMKNLQTSQQEKFLLIKHFHCKYLFC
jgi:hypothetical protein